MIKIGERVKVVVNRSEVNFDKACDMAYNLFTGRIGLDDDGYANNVEGWYRSGSILHVRFVEYTQSASMGGHNFKYVFEGWVENYEDEED